MLKFVWWTIHIKWYPKSKLDDDDDNNNHDNDKQFKGFLEASYHKWQKLYTYACLLFESNQLLSYFMFVNLIKSHLDFLRYKESYSWEKT